MNRPVQRPRRLRNGPVVRGLVRESTPSVEQLVLPLFVVDGTGIREPVQQLPGVERRSIDEASGLIEEALDLGIRAFAPFPSVRDRDKDAEASMATREDSLGARTIRALADRFPEAILVADVALDPYSSDGHDGLVVDGRIVNDPTVDVLAEMAVMLAECGAGIVAPSDMMDGRVGSIRTALDRAGSTDTIIMSYAAKYASAFYGPFRAALDSAPTERPGVPSDKRSYQMDPANSNEAVREARLDLEEGADIVMVKPGLPYLDVIRRLRSELDSPVAAYHVSGEFAMLRFAAAAGALRYEDALAESIQSLTRAGADIVLTYGAIDFARIIRAGGDR
ncbi:MAG: porphobilinogen synthase [Planctomycetaceae bacterium]|nr:porphobilinogen synthase [Planctomycetaceae bacterium]